MPIQKENPNIGVGNGLLTQVEFKNIKSHLSEDEGKNLMDILK